MHACPERNVLALYKYVFFSPPPMFPNPVETPEEETTTATVSLLGSSVLFVGLSVAPHLPTLT